ncbi:tripartite tricarboxylate transporter permease [Marinovum sp.]|uniref:tripartite tricarboxylate transporter permease n=1 Tax=Marinovum sp. TaxID=2024839 RepID=UPI003A8D35A7
MIEHLPYAFSIALGWQVLAAMAIGTVAGIIIGGLPGLGTVLGLVIALPFTFSMEPATAIALLLALYVSSIYGGSISAILINVPGTPQSAASVLDGYPMSQKGKGDLALGYATIASFVGGVVSLVVLIIFAPQLARFALSFGPIETFALILFALTTVAGVSADDMLKGLIATLIGLFLSLIGPDEMTGQIRFDFDNLFLAAGLSAIPLLIGIFAISEVLFQAGIATDSGKATVIKGGFRLPSWADWKPRLVTLLRSCGIGSMIGVLPGTGATAATFVSYADAKRRAPNPEDFGQGEPSGLIASEASNNAVSGGAMVPMLSLGIPGDAGTAVMLGALAIHNIAPGAQLFQGQPHTVALIFVLLFVANIFMLVFGAAGASLYSRVLQVPVTLLMPVVLLLCTVGTYAARSNPIDLVVMLVLGLAGFVMRLNRFPLAPIIIGFILGAPLERALRQGLILTDTNILAFFEKPIALVLFIVTGLILLNLMGLGRLARRAFGRKAPHNAL